MRKQPTFMYLVPEFCFMTGLTSKQRTDFTLMRNMGEFTRPTPQARVRWEIEFNASGLPSEACLSAKYRNPHYWKRAAKKSKRGCRYRGLQIEQIWSLEWTFFPLSCGGKLIRLGAFGYLASWEVLGNLARQGPLKGRDQSLEMQG